MYFPHFKSHKSQIPYRTRVCQYLPTSKNLWSYIRLDWCISSVLMIQSHPVCGLFLLSFPITDISFNNLPMQIHLLALSSSPPSLPPVLSTSATDREHSQLTRLVMRLLLQMTSPPPLPLWFMHKDPHTQEKHTHPEGNSSPVLSSSLLELWSRP